jgi:hypothetical protein
MYAHLQADILHLNFTLPITLPLMPKNKYANICTLFVTGNRGAHTIVWFLFVLKLKV